MEDALRRVFGRWLAGQIACAKELAIFFAPTVNSYKRYAAGSWAPTTLAWGNRRLPRRRPRRGETRGDPHPRR